MGTQAEVLSYRAWNSWISFVVWFVLYMPSKGNEACHADLEMRQTLWCPQEVYFKYESIYKLRANDVIMHHIKSNSKNG